MPAGDWDPEKNDHDGSSDRSHERSRGGSQRGATPIVSTILVVGIVVVLGAVVATLALGLGENVQDSPPEAAFVCTEHGNVRHVAGDNIPVDRLEGVRKSQVEGEELTAGEAVSVDELVWEYRETSYLLTECGSTSVLSFDATLGRFPSPLTLPSNTTGRLRGPGRLRVDIRGNGTPFDPPGGVDVEITQNPGDNFSLLVNGVGQGDSVTGLNTSNGTFTDTVEVLPSGVLNRDDEYRIELTATDVNGNEASDVIRMPVADYELQSVRFAGANNNSGTGRDDNVTFEANITNHADSGERTTVAVWLYESRPALQDSPDAAAQKTVQITQGNTRTITQADFPGLITDDGTIDDDTVYYLYVVVTNPPNLRFKAYQTPP